MAPDTSLESGLEPALDRAARAVDDADAILVTAGAGMGVDSGLPDFRGPEGFWRAYPAFRDLGLRFEQLASPHWFFRDPALAWGFYGHRLGLYRETVPHEGFRTLLRWASETRHGAFVFTSNVDGQFQKAGFPDGRVAECHGSIHHLQCLRGCGEPIRSAEGVDVEVDAASCRAREPFPTCPGCRGLARPNILLFGDLGWDDARTSAQMETLGDWLDGVSGPLVVLELGAGTSVPSVRTFSERAVQGTRRTLVRINPREPELGRDFGAPASDSLEHLFSASRHAARPTGISLPLGALEAIRAIDARRAAGRR
ncbi:MAG: NAD-dependent protein deacetylase [Thermoanaerobaculia bacterium]|nr:NAD-dependent protein deacetylase [Thermoanaerobaculia bacterium]